ncbi:long-chain specific acyl-CoA dehydrogenase, mitochondrial-like [Ischnura elegans]|uniref:long-chain specific acyl-CoA dehydrogenase, mitochondrial-like n=1 Tax=Ischnura elegans TaxID=197161 RepID=UPI001ED87C3F|nr:long-chain specific acyl-CoA dehydrogenase, mitochondrial-like [Ischnura elegans]
MYSSCRARLFSWPRIRFFSSSIDDNRAYRLTPGQMETMLDIGSRAIFNEDHDTLRKSVRRFFREEMMPFRKKWENDGMVDRSAWSRMGELGLLGIDTPVSKGGPGGSFLHSVIIMEEQSLTEALGSGFILHSDIVLPYIIHYGSEEQIKMLVPDMLAGKKIGAIAMTEPHAGSDLQGIKTRAIKKEDGGYVLNGSKCFITNGAMADVVIVVAVTNPTAKSPAHGISLLLVNSDAEGFSRGKPIEKIGHRTQDVAELFFDDVHLPPNAVLGKENHGFMYLMNQLPRERLLIGITAVAHCEWMFEETRSYVGNRKAFGCTLADLQTVQHKLAEMKTEICIARAFIDQCIDVFNHGKLDSSTASMAKYWMSELEVKIASQCVQLHGGWGYAWETPIARAFAQARVQPIYGGSNEIMKELIARGIVGKKKA